MNALVKFFAYEHLPPALQEISKPVCELARAIDNRLPESAEKTAGLRKLLEAKDCFVRALVPVLVLLLVAAAAPARAQGFGVAGDFAVGAGFMFSGEEAQAFDAESVYAALHWNGLKLPGPSVSTGIGLEVHPASIAIDGSVVNADYRLWSLNRFDCPSALYCGTDLKIGEGGENGWIGDFDVRIVTGVAVYDGPALDVNAEFYFLEDDRPIAAAVVLRWGGSNQPQRPAP